MAKYAIVDDTTPNRCTIVRIVEHETSQRERETGIPPSWWSRSMRIADGVEVQPGDRAWHRGREIVSAG